MLSVLFFKSILINCSLLLNLHLPFFGWWHFLNSINVTQLLVKQFMIKHVVCFHRNGKKNYLTLRLNCNHVHVEHEHCDTNLFLIPYPFFLSLSQFPYFSPSILLTLSLSFSLSLELVRCCGLIWLHRKSAVIEQTASEIWWQMGPDPSKLLSAQIEISFSLLLGKMK